MSRHSQRKVVGPVRRAHDSPQHSESPQRAKQRESPELTGSVDVARSGRLQEAPRPVLRKEQR